MKEIHKFKILYKASDHEYSHKVFHKLCDNASPTITIICVQLQTGAKNALGVQAKFSSPALTLPALDAPASVPFFDNSGAESIFRRIA